MTFGLFDKYVAQISALPSGTLNDGHFAPFLLNNSHPPLEIYYAPFDWCNVDARIVVVGITPGRNSMRVALEVARDALHAGCSPDEASMRAKQTGSFSNMRNNLSNRLDALGIHEALGIRSCAELFAARADLLHTTSAIRYPVLKGGINYGGYSPSLTTHVLFVEFIRKYLAPEIQQFPRALFVPNGPAVAKALLLAGADLSRCLMGFPHASNGPGARERAARFESEKQQLRKKVVAWADG